MLPLKTVFTVWCHLYKEQQNLQRTAKRTAKWLSASPKGSIHQRAIAAVSLFLHLYHVLIVLPPDLYTKWLL